MKSFRQYLADYLNGPIGLSFFLGWVACTFYSSVIWNGEKIGLFNELPLIVTMLLSGIFGFIIILVVGNRTLSRWTWPTWTPWVAAVLCVVGTMFLLEWINLGVGHVFSIITGAIILSVGFSTFVLLWGSGMSTLDGGAIEIFAPISFIIAQTISFLLNLCDTNVAGFIASSLPFLSAFFYFRSKFSAPEKAEPLHFGSAESKQKSKLLSAPEWIATVLILLVFRFWYGSVRATSEGSLPSEPFHYFVSYLLALIIFSVFIYTALSYARSLDVSLAVTWILPLILITFAGMHWAEEGKVEFVRISNSAVSYCLQAFFYILFAKAAKQRRENGVFYFACYLTGLALGTSLGAISGSLISQLHDQATILFVLSITLAIIGSLAMILIRRTGSLSASPMGITVNPTGQEACTRETFNSAEDSMKRRTRAIANASALSNREEEILFYLLMGRSRPYIRDILFISINTVNTHIKRIYAKVDVHSQQELIDLAHNNVKE